MNNLGRFYQISKCGFSWIDLFWSKLYLCDKFCLISQKWCMLWHTLVSHYSETCLQEILNIPEKMSLHDMRPFITGSLSWEGRTLVWERVLTLCPYIPYSIWSFIASCATKPVSNGRLNWISKEGMRSSWLDDLGRVGHHFVKTCFPWSLDSLKVLMYLVFVWC